MSTVEVVAMHDLGFDPNDVGSDLVVECWISQGPRADDSSFDPSVGEWLLVSDDEGPPLRARVTRRLGDRVWVQVALSVELDAAV